MQRRILIAGLVCGCFSGALAQQRAALPSFEAASIKPAAPMQPGRMMVGMNGGPGTPDTSQMKFTNVSLTNLIENAYDVKDYQISGPGWLESTRFDISAKLPAGTTKEQSKLMLQELLAERFRLVLHRSTKESSIYALLVAKNGPKLKEAVEDPNAAPPPDVPLRSGPPAGGGFGGPPIGKDGMPQLPPGARRPGSTMMMMVPGGRMRLVAIASTIGNFLGPLAMQLDRPVVDMTGLKGKYDITLDFAPDPSIMQAKMMAMVGPPPPPPPPGDGGGPGGGSQDAGAAATIFSALPDQLGLRLEARKGPVELLIIDSAQKAPTEN